ncbi:MAG: DinB family protein [Flavobacteriaceae bacterium]|nr:DinB family protein [Flavobacteriaceae bacterium]
MAYNMIEAIEYNLKRGIRLLNTITDIQYSDTSIEPYHSSIGGHMRHILDVFDCIFCGLESKKVDLAARKRNELAEQKTAYGLAYFEETLEQLNALKGVDLNQMVEVSDDLGLGTVTTNYTLASALIQAHSHAIHHFASIGYIISKLGIELPDADFGYNPTTPRLTQI